MSLFVTVAHLILLHGSLISYAVAQSPTESAYVAIPTGAAYINWSQIVIDPLAKVNYNQDLGPCMCDLTQNKCDPNCCCDPDCSELASNSAVLAQCPSPVFKPLVPLCSSLLVTINNAGAMGAMTFRGGDGALCVSISNSPVQGFFYQDPGAVFQSDNYFSEQISLIKYSYYTSIYDVKTLYQRQLTPSSASTNLPPYRYGESILISYNTAPDYLGRFPLPSASDSGLCNDANSAKYFVSEITSCSRQITPSSAESLCSSNTALDVAYYITGYQILAFNKTSFSIDKSTCLDPASRRNVPCTNLSPIWNQATSTCNRIVVGLSFTFNYDVSGGETYLTSIKVLPKFGNFSIGSIPIQILQKFEIMWAKTGTSPIPKSGNPGYIIGKPVLFGTILSQPTAAIAYFPSLENSLSFPIDVVSSDGSIGCSNDPSNRMPITFGEDSISGCTIQLSMDDMTAIGCAAVRTLVNSIQTSNSAIEIINRVGKFGNSNVTKESEWIPLIKSQFGDVSSPDLGSGTCSSVLTEISLQFLTVDLGSSNNPQPAIVGARLVKTYGVLQYRCLTLDDCRSGKNKTQSFRLKNSVSFVRVANDGAKGYTPPAPQLAPLPDDLFYPFKLRSSSEKTILFDKLRIFFMTIAITYIIS